MNINSDILNEFLRNNIMVPYNFIRDYALEATPEQISVYLIGLSLAQIKSKDIINNIKKEIPISETTIKSALRYWNDKGVLKINSFETYDITFTFVNRHVEHKYENKYESFNQEMQSILTKSQISPYQYSLFYNLIKDYNFNEDALILVAVYLTKNGIYSPIRICHFAQELADRNITTLKGVDSELKTLENQTELARMMLSIMGKKSTKFIEPEDAKYIREWMSLGFTREALLKAVELAKRRSFQYLDDFLQDFNTANIKTVEEISQFIEQRRTANSITKYICKVFGRNEYANYEGLNRMYTNSWLSLGYDSKSLKLIADYIFAMKKNSFEELDEFIKDMYKQGIVVSDSINKYFKYIEYRNQQIQNILKWTNNPTTLITQNRIEFFNTWTQDWGFNIDNIKTTIDNMFQDYITFKLLNNQLSILKSNNIYGSSHIKEFMSKFPKKFSANKISDEKIEKMKKLTEQLNREE